MHQLCQPPARFTIETTQLGLTGHGASLSVPQLRELLTAPTKSIEVKNRAWAMVVTRAQHDHPGWRLAAVGLALPRLRSLATELCRGYQGDRGEVETEILTGFLTALAQARTPAQQRFPALVRAARHAGLAWLRQHRLAAPTIADPATLDPDQHTTRSAPLTTTTGPAGHPDLVLADAVAAGILTRVDVDIIAATRLEGRTLRVVAAAYSVSTQAVWQRRHRAEKRLLAALSTALAPDDADRADDPTHAHLLAAAPARGTPRSIRANPLRPSPGPHPHHSTPSCWAGARATL